MEIKESNINQDTLDFIFEYTKNAPEIQLKDVENLDNKVIQILSITSVIIGLSGFVIGNIDVESLSTVALVIALVAYSILAVVSFVHLKAGVFRRSLQADALWGTYWNDDIKAIKHSLVDDISKAYAYNKKQIMRKRRTLLAIVVCAAIEVTAIGVFIVSAV